MSWPTRVCVSSDGNNAHTSDTVPIFFVPGVMGSRMRLPGGDFWDPDSSWRMKSWLATKRVKTKADLLNASAGAAATILDDVPGHVMDPSRGSETHSRQQRGWYGVAKEFYHGLLEHLDGKSAKCAYGAFRLPVCAVGYDWRQPNAKSGRAVAKEIKRMMEGRVWETEAERSKQKTPSKEPNHCIIISHSMGGLVTRSMLKANSDLAKKTLAIIHIAQPVDGACAIYRRMFTGTLGSVDGGWKLAKVLGIKGEHVRTILSGALGPLELLPTKRYRVGYGDWVFQQQHDNTVESVDADGVGLYCTKGIPPGLIAKVYEGKVNPDSIGSPYEERLEASLRKSVAAQEKLKHWKLERGRTFSIFCADQDTDVQVTHTYMPPNDRSEQVRLGHPNRRAFGDGSVPANSAGALFKKTSQRNLFMNEWDPKARQWEVHGAKHDAITDNLACQGLVDKIVALALTKKLG